MNQFKFEAFLVEFPFIGELIQNSEFLDGIRVAPATRELLSTIPTRNTYSGSRSSVDEWTRVHFVLGDGSILQGAVEVSCVFQDAARDTEYRDGDSILEAIYRHKVADRLTYILWEEGGYARYDFDSLPNFKATVYKPSREFTWEEIIAEVKASAMEEVRKESDF